MTTIRIGKPLTAAAPRTWTVIGELRSDGTPAKFMWADGKLSSFPIEAMRDIDAYVHTGRDVAVTPTGPFLDADPTDELSAYVLAHNALSHVDTIGDPPKLPDLSVPDGAIP